jgi:hypothetical protein
MGRFGTSWENSRMKSMLRQGLMHRSKNEHGFGELFDHLVGTTEQRQRNRQAEHHR